MQDSPVWKEIIGFLCPKDYGLFEEVNLAAEDPEGYFEEYRAELGERGIEDPSGITPWLAMVDGLISRKCLVEVDLKVDPADLRIALSELSIARERRIDLQPLVGSDVSGEPLLHIAGQVVGTYNLGLHALDISSDSWPLVLLPLEHNRRLAELVKRLGATATSFS